MAKATTIEDGLSRFLSFRALKERAVQLLIATSKDNALPKGALTAAQNATYEVLAEHLLKAISKGWLALEDLIGMLNEAEQAGKQHVCVFNLPGGTGTSAIMDGLRKPRHRLSGARSLEEFWDVPDESFAEILRDTSKEVVVKIVTKREYWKSELDKETATEQWIHKMLQKERAAVILKCKASSGVFQVRVPPRQRYNQGETGKSVYEIVESVVDRHFGIGKTSWFQSLKRFPITDAYNAILLNRDDFCLRHDTPESDTAKSRLSKKGSLKNYKDLRDDGMWDFEKGYSRQSLRGSWDINKNKVYAHLNFDRLRVDSKTNYEFARVFFPQFATDSEVDHVIGRIRDHL